MEIAMILLIALGTFVFMPDAPDTFELPKRIFSCALGVLLVLWPERRKVDCSLDGGCRVGAGRFVGALGLALLAWMVFRTVAEGAYEIARALSLRRSKRDSK